MADIRSYMKEKEKREKKQSGYKQKIIRHKLTAVYRVLLVVAVFAAVPAYSISGIFILHMILLLLCPERTLEVQRISGWEIQF